FGVLGSIVSSLLVCPVTNAYLNLSLILSFSSVFPYYEILLFLCLPLKMKLHGLLDAGFLGWAFLSGHANVKAGIAAAMLNYLLFFAGPLWERLRGRAARSVQRRATGLAPEPKRRPRVRAKCGRSAADQPDLEVR